MEIPENETLDEKKARTKKIENASKVLLKVKDALKELEDRNEDIDIDDFFSQLGISYENYEQALKKSSCGNTIVLKRKIKERMINNYNAKMLKVWNANSTVSG